MRMLVVAQTTRSSRNDEDDDENTDDDTEEIDNDDDEGDVDAGNTDDSTGRDEGCFWLRGRLGRLDIASLIPPRRATRCGGAHGPKCRLKMRRLLLTRTLFCISNDERRRRGLW